MILAVKSHEVHPSHRVVDDGWIVSDPRCEYCRVSPLEDKATRLLLPCPKSPHHGKLL